MRFLGIVSCLVKRQSNEGQEIGGAKPDLRRRAALVEVTCSRHLRLTQMNVDISSFARRKLSCLWKLGLYYALP